jgi:SAM-dependent methyltransferase
MAITGSPFMYKTTSLLIAFIISFISHHAYASYDSEEIDFKRSLEGNNVLGSSTTPAPLEVINDQSVAWGHQRSIRRIVQEHKYSLPAARPDGEIPTQNDMGYHWGLGPAIVVKLGKLIEKKGPIKLLEIGSCYGFDAIALLQRYEDLSITAVELSSKHHAVMKQLVEDILTENESQRLTMIQGDFIELADDLFAPPFDIVVISKVLHFYDEKDNLPFLAKVKALLKPEGYLVMSHMSNQSHFILKYVTGLTRGWFPRPDGILNNIKSCHCGPILWGYYFSTEAMASLAKKTGFNIETNEYTGIVHNKEADRYWFIGGIHRDLCALFTVLRKPDEAAKPRTLELADPVIMGTAQLTDDEGRK